MLTTAPTTPAARRVRWIAVLVPALVSLLAAALGVVLVTAQQDRLPDPVATHWGPGGIADGFSSLSNAVVTGAVLTVVPSLFLLVLGLVVREHIWLPGTASGLAVMLSVVTFGSLRRQAGLSQAAGATIGPELVLGSLGGVLVGGLVVAILGVLDHRVPRPQTTAPLPAGLDALPPSRTLTWQGQTRQGRLGRWFVAMPAIVMLAFGLWAAWQRQWWLLLFVAVIGLVTGLLLATLNCQVTITEARVVARGGGIAWLTVPLDQIEYADTTQVHALEYGGMGMRVAVDGTRALVTDRGEALRLVRHQAPACVLTIDDAAGAAATVNALIAASRG